jgi:Protein of unknown function (DUF2800)
MGDATTHSRISASSCERWWNCPGSVKACEGIPENRSKYAAEGTVAHALAAKLLLGKGLPDEGDVIEEGEYKIEVTAEMVEAIATYAEAVLTDAKALGVGLKGIKVERELILHTVHPEARGTVDAYISAPFETLVVYDFKYGAGYPIEAVENKQLMYYAIGAILAEKEVTVDGVELVIVQPRTLHKDGPVRRWKVSLDALAAFAKDLAAHARAVERVPAPLATGKWCKWCNAFPVCPAANKRVKESAPRNARPEDLLVSQIVKAMNEAEYIADWVSAVKALAYNMLLTGQQIPGYGLKEGRGTRKWLDEMAVAEQLAEFGDAIYKPKEIKSPAQMEKVVGKDRVEELTEKLKGELKMVKEENAENIKTGAAAVFANVPIME